VRRRLAWCKRAADLAKLDERLSNAFLQTFSEEAMEFSDGTQDVLPKKFFFAHKATKGRFPQLRWILGRFLRLR
jgi:hypothetical protein